jgi:hypothetical protein
MLLISDKEKLNYKGKPYINTQFSSKGSNSKEALRQAKKDMREDPYFYFCNVCNYYKARHFEILKTSYVTVQI